MTIIAEIGTSHGGSLGKAHALIDGAAEAGADCVKFQWVYADEILHPDTGFVSLPGGSVRLYDRFRALEVSPAFFADCRDYAKKKGLSFVCSPFGLRSLEELLSLGPDAVKIASPEVNHMPLLAALSSSYGKVPVILSSGVSTLGDIEAAVEAITGGRSTECAGGAFPQLSLLHCITSYPAPEEEYNVRCVESLSRITGLPTGISDHSLDPVLIPVLTVAEGGTMIEKHITLSRETDGLDDPVALEVAQFSQMVQAVHQAEAVVARWQRELYAAGGAKDGGVRNEVPQQAREEILRQMSAQYGAQKVRAALGTGIKRLAPSERANYGRTNRSLHYLRGMSAGQTVGPDDVAVLRTEKVLSPGLHPSCLADIAGAVLVRGVEAGDGVSWQDFILRKK